MDRKEEQVRRYLKAQKHHRTRDEEQELKRRSSERKAARRNTGRRERQDWSQGDEGLEAFESIPRTPKYRRGTRAEVPGASAGVDAPADPAIDPGAVGIVLSLAPGRARVVVGGVERDAGLAEELARTQKTSLAVGDEVVLAERAPDVWRVVAVRPRRSLLSRPDPARPGLERAIAANVDRAVVVVAVRSPHFRARLIDRYLIAVQRGGVEPIVCANKADLLPDGAERDAIDATLALHRAVGVPAFFTSTATGEGLAELRHGIEGRAVVFVGQSGVGKSSLLNALYPELGLATGGVRAGDGKGRHTTTRSTRLELPDGTRVIDTPGVRSFGLADLDRASLGRYFPELAAHEEGCRFRDCTHAHEPACAVRAAVEAGGVPRVRYGTYLRILETLD